MDTSKTFKNIDSEGSRLMRLVKIIGRNGSGSAMDKVKIVSYGKAVIVVHMINNVTIMSQRT